MTYDLWYWPSIPGRGEFVRLALEARMLAYRDRAREEGAQALIEDMRMRTVRSPFAPPYLVAGDVCVAQSANILQFLADRHALGPTSSIERAYAHQLQLTIADAVAEAHNVHHPVSASLYYEEQKPEAARAAEAFREERMPKFLRHFEAALEASGPWLLGASWSYADLSLFQLFEGLRYALPRRTSALAPELPFIAALVDKVAQLPQVAAYLASERRVPFNENGIFRYYPELDGD